MLIPKTAMPSWTPWPVSVITLDRKSLLPSQKSFSLKIVLKGTEILWPKLFKSRLRNFLISIWAFLYSSRNPSLWAFLSSSKPKNSHFQFILDSLNAKMGGWKTNFLNMAGRNTLAKASLSSMSNHIMQYITLSNKIQKYIDRIQRNFTWGTTN